MAGQTATSINDPNAWLCTWIAGLWQLADDLYVDLRDSPQGWNARVAPGFIDRRVDAIPAGPATWQEAAQLLLGWLRDHRDGACVAALERLLEDPQAYATR